MGRNTAKASNLSLSLRTIPNGQTDQSVVSVIVNPCSAEWQSNSQGFRQNILS